MDSRITGDDAFRLDKPERCVDNGFWKCCRAVICYSKYLKLTEKKKSPNFSGDIDQLKLNALN